jgi:DNA polymerase family B
LPRRKGWIPGDKPLNDSQRQAKSRSRHNERILEDNSKRPFIGWDGEGVNTKGSGNPQAYVLFGASTGDFITIRDGGTLAFGDCAELILKVGRENPTAWHVGFAFDYDVNQLIRTLPFYHLDILNQTGRVRYGPYRISWHRGKSFTLSRNTGGIRQTVTIYDVFSFFATSFIKAIKSILGNDSEYRDRVTFVAAGKQRRKEFTLKELDSEIYPYWKEEIQLLSILVSRFRDLLYSAGFPITKWYGPGALASYVLNRQHVPDHMAVAPDEVIEAAQYAYAGGRFEMFRVGRYQGPVWAIDINSAYPDALSRLPSLTGGEWTFQPIGKHVSEMAREDIHPFAIYHVRLSHERYRLPWFPNTPPGPLFYRTPQGEMRYPWHVEGWYWTPEVENLFHPRIAPHAYVYGAWVFLPSKQMEPFAFIPEMYSLRRQWKREGKPEQIALKLAMNSIYGKLAQRVGWEQKNAAPRFHQLEWAGYVTSYVRAKLFRALWGLGNDIISVETDGIFTTRDPATIGITPSSELGGWDFRHYDEIIYIQSGTYFARTETSWVSKYRGLDPQSLSVDMAIRYLQSIDIGSRDAWPKLRGTTTRYIGLAAAMQHSSGVPERFRAKHGVWQQERDRDLAPGTGKRSHYPDSCVECSQGISPYDYPHYLGIGLDYREDGIWESTKHYLPWRDGTEIEDTLAWRRMVRDEQDKLFEE